ncbi:sugar phosphate isomerase/epimerase family protein [Belliella aquatica]|uniref:Sugar phosphate isomerase n=1 Tax=Belliella aquatica TaxID=1323734 RepID=A0ABQ1N2S2_9BACT|nr:sugar phosphate isomerase/epimerase [Belliella aquatica]MCH7407171.1 sugar phosphate isomerase/epimerase [Belliella aquatica]GGC52497.1 sugar phosphate isomerase [Belliella aquatica]
MKDRRKFLKLSAAMGMGALLPLQFCSPKKEEQGSQETLISPAEGTLASFGIQLWSVKENMFEDHIGTIKSLATYGYNQIEGFNIGKGIFWGMKNTEFKTLMDDNGLDFISSHTNTFEDLERQAAEAGEIGMKYLINPYVGPQKSMDDFKRLADDFNKQGEICKQNGIRFAYHNHGYTFEELEGQIPQEYLMDNTDPELVDFELDLYWVYSAGHDPLKWLEKYPNRFPLGHVKDKDGSVDRSEADGSTVIGTGILDFSTMLKNGRDNGMKYFIVEQERYVDISPMEAAEKNASYMKSLIL